MVKEYGPPTLFLTLRVRQSRDSHVSQKNGSDSYPIGKLCTEDPVAVSRIFSQKFHNFFRTVILNGKCWVVLLTTKEYQASGAPRYHILLWIEGAPVAGKDDDDVVLQFIKERITCHIPEEASNPELHRLVTKYQYHK